MLAMVREGSFRPDADRSGRFKSQLQESQGASSSSSSGDMCTACKICNSASVILCEGCSKLFHYDPPCMADCDACGVHLCLRCHGPNRHQWVELIEDVKAASGDEQISDDSEDSAEEEASLAKLPVMSAPLEEADSDELLTDLLKSTKYGTVHPFCIGKYMENYKPDLIHFPSMSLMTCSWHPRPFLGIGRID